MYTIESRVRYSEVDHRDTITLPAIINYFQDCSTFQSEDIGFGIDYLKEKKQGWVLSSWQVIVERYPKMGERIEVRTWATGFEGLFGTRNFQMCDENGETLAYANSIWVYMDAQKGRPVKPDADHVARYGVEEPLPMEYASRKISLPKETEELEVFPVRRCHIDTNEHVNNCQYVQMALDVLPEEIQVKQLRAEYRKSAVYGDVMLSKVAREEDRTVVELCDLDGKLYAVVELTGEK